MAFNSSSPYPEGVISFLDTDLYKLTMQCAVFKYYRDVPVTYSFTNRTPEKKLSRAAFQWLTEQVHKLGNISLSAEELTYLEAHCPYLSGPYLAFLKEFRLNPREQVTITFHPVAQHAADTHDNDNTETPDDLGDIDIAIRGPWVDTILYEIPILALTSEAYFRFMDTEWTYENQQQLAYDKGMRFLEAGCVLSEFGTRRRRDYHTQALVFRGLLQASKAAAARGYPGGLAGTSNVHLAMRFNLPPVGTVAHEWFMGIAALTGQYAQASEEALCRWVGCFGEGVLGIALTDTFGTPEFLRNAFARPVRRLHPPGEPQTLQQQSQQQQAQVQQQQHDLQQETTPAATRQRRPTAADAFTTAIANAPTPTAPAPAPAPATTTTTTTATTTPKTYAQIFTGVRQDSGDPAEFVKTMRAFYDEQGITDKKVIVFSDSLNLERCLEYKRIAEAAGFQPTFGVGTYLSNDFVNRVTGKKSVPLNIVIKLSSANGRPAIKISDNIGKNTGDHATVERVKRELGYVEKDWVGGDETHRWGTEGDKPAQAP